ncbi:MAG: hypothetical protein Q9221_000335 [Calogaya cf. arnoldii]
MHFWVHVSKGFAFVVATTGGLGFLGYGPVKSLHPYAKLGIQLTIETPKRLAYSVPARNPPQPGAPLFSSTTLVDVSGSDVYITESRNNSTAANTFAPTKTHDSHIFLPARLRGMELTVPTALAEAAQSLAPFSWLAGHCPLPPFLHDIIPYTNVSAHLSTIVDSQLGLIGFLLIIMALVSFIIVIRRSYQAGPEATAQSEQATKHHLLENAWLDAVVLNDIVHKDREDLQRRNDHPTNLLLSAFVTINSQSEDFASCMTQATEESTAKYEALEGNLSALVSRNHTLAGWIYDLGDGLEASEARNQQLKRTSENTAEELTEAMGKLASMKTDYENLDKKCQDSASENEGLLQADNDLEGQNGDLENKLSASEAECSSLEQENTDYKTRNRQLEEKSNDLQLRKDEAEQELDNVKSERDVLVRKVEDYRISAETSEKEHADLVGRMGAEVSRLASANNDARLLRNQEKDDKDDMAKKLKKANEALKSIKSSKSTAEKKLEDKNASLERRLKQVGQEKKRLEDEKAALERRLMQAEQKTKAIQEDNEDLSSRLKSMDEISTESQEEAKAAHATIERLGIEAQRRRTDRDTEDSQLTAHVEKEQEKKWAAHYAAQLHLRDNKLVGVTAEKTAVEMN